MRVLLYIIAVSVFSQYSSHFGYLGIFLFFLTIDQITFIPEEVTLLSIGYMASNHIFNPFIAGIVSAMAFLTVDTSYYFLARSGNKFIKKIMERKKDSLVSKYRKKMKDHFGPTLLVLCFIPRMRMFGPILAGLMKLSFKKFILFDSIGISVFTALYISLGIIFHNTIHLHQEKIQHIVFACAMVVLSGIIFLIIKKKK
jgi:membrane-associated protein